MGCCQEGGGDLEGDLPQPSCCGVVEITEG